MNTTAVENAAEYLRRACDHMQMAARGLDEFCKEEEKFVEAVQSVNLPAYMKGEETNEHTSPYKLMMDELIKGNRIAAIKILRETLVGMGLREAKYTIDFWHDNFVTKR